MDIKKNPYGKILTEEDLKAMTTKEKIERAKYVGSKLDFLIELTKKRIAQANGNSNENI